MTSGRAEGGEKRKAPSLAPSEPVVHAEPISDFLDRTDVSSTAGLTEADAEKRLGRYGPNRLPEPKKKSNVLRLLEQFVNLRVPLDRFQEAFEHRGGKATLVLADD